MEMAIAKRLQTYINAELGDAELYRQLAPMAPNEMSKKLIMEFADDEQSHANEFKQIYKNMTGRAYNPTVQPVEFTDTYENILRDRVLDESGDFRKYRQQYMTAPNQMLKNAYFRAGTDENVHALRLLYLLSEASAL